MQNNTHHLAERNKFQIWFGYHSQQETFDTPRSVKNSQASYQELQENDQEIQETLDSCRFPSRFPNTNKINPNQIRKLNKMTWMTTNRHGQIWKQETLAHTNPSRK